MSSTRFLFLGSAVAAAALFWAFVVMDSGSTGDGSWAHVEPVAGSEGLERWRPGKHRAARSIQRRDVDDAVHFRQQWSLGDVSPEALAAASNAQEHGGRVSEAEPGWGEFYNAISDPFFLGEVVDLCGPVAKPFENCFVSVNLVAEPAESASGPASVATYAEVAGTDPMSLECRKYASCMAENFLGRELPALPPGSGPEGTVTTWHMDAWDDDRIQISREKVERCITRAEEGIAILQTDPMESEAEMAYQREGFEARLAWCQSLRERQAQGG